MYLYSYNINSLSARRLSEAANLRRIKHHNSNFVGSEDKTVVNWGATELPEAVQRCQVLNRDISIASNKLRLFEFLKDMEDIRIPSFCTRIEDVPNLMGDKGGSVFARTMLRASAGRGIQHVIDPEHVPAAPLYVRYIPKSDEYRVHVFNNTVIAVQRKARKHNVPDQQVNWRIRTHENGFVYIRVGVNPPDDVINQSLKVVEATNLLFGAVDVIWSQRKQKAYVLEINTAPGLEGQTVQNYSDAIRSYRND